MSTALTTPAIGAPTLDPTRRPGRPSPHDTGPHDTGPHGEGPAGVRPPAATGPGHRPATWPATWPSTDTGRVLVLVEDPLARRAIDAALRAEGLAARATTDPSSADVLMRSYRPTVMIVEARHLSTALARRALADADVRLVVHGADPAARLSALRNGADDALAPDCSPAEIALRCAAFARQPGMSRSALAGRRLQFGRVVIDLGRRTITVDGDEITATRLEFDLFAELCRRPAEVCTRAQLLESVWGPRWVGDPHVVDVHLSNLRRKVRDRAPDLQLLCTVRGVGFRLSDGWTPGTDADAGAVTGSDEAVAQVGSAHA